MNMIKKIFSQKNFSNVRFSILSLMLVVLFSFFVFFPDNAKAATLYFVPESQNLNINGELKVDLKIDTQDASINAAQVTVKFSPAFVKFVDFDKSASVFNFWLEEPIASNDNGTVSFIAGTAKGISGGALQVISLRFKVIGSGATQITAADAAVTASDGSGANILSNVKTANVGIGVSVGAPTPTAEVPQKITREAVPGEKTPGEPKLRIPLYPDESRWYSQVGNLIVMWDLPQDVTQVSARLTQRQETSVGQPEKELFNGKNFGVLKEGIWYVRVQFKNNIGWGNTAYYKISLDATAPIPFTIKIDSTVSDNPSPALDFETSDSLSGISAYSILVDGKEVLRTASSSLNLPPQLPGKHNLVIKAFDMAGNGIEDSVAFEVLPLEKPAIKFFPKSVASGELVFLSGETMSSGFVEVHIADSNNQEIIVKKVNADGLGHWEMRIDDFLPQGTYSITAIARDSRGASSYPTDPSEVRIRAKAVFAIGGFDITWFEIFLFMIVVAMGVGGYFWRLNIMAEDKRAAYRIIIGRDFQNLSELLEKHIIEYEKIAEKFDAEDKIKIEGKFIYDKIKDTVDKIRKYIGKELSKIK